jgi:hypothetical protein
VALVPLAFFIWRSGSEELRPAKREAAQKGRPTAKARPRPGLFGGAKSRQYQQLASALDEPSEALPPPRQLENPPEIVKGVYLTSWSAGLKQRIDYVEKLARTVGVNTVVIDIKDYSGNLAYRAAVPEVQKYGAVHVKIRDIDGLIRRLHAARIYVIARITVFQDPVLAAARPELAVHRKSLLAGGAKPSRGTLWLDHKGLAWIDPAAKPAWEYTAAIGRDALSHGFDELNFDYVRFPSDGNMRDMHFPISGDHVSKPAVLREFFAYLRRSFEGARISADLFGLATVNSDDLGIGQVIEDAYLNFDYVCPMVYPSHYAPGFRGFKRPAEHPYEVVRYSMDRAVARLRSLTARPAHTDGQAHVPAGAFKPAAPAAKPVRVAKLRPWLQDFDLGGNYDAAQVRAQIRATEEALGADYAGYLLWSPSNVYTAGAFTEEITRSHTAPATPALPAPAPVQAPK